MDNNKIIRVIKQPGRLLVFLASKNIIKMSDRLFLILAYKYRTGKKLDLNNPQTFNEKLQWLKLYDRNSLYTNMVDKYEVREYIKNTIGEEYLVPLIGVYDDFDKIDFNKLPKQFVIKCNHDSGGLVICKNKKNLNISKSKKRINNCLKKEYFYSGREWPYKNIRPKILIEKYMEDSSTGQLMDYKLFCFNGKFEFIQVDYDRFINHSRCLYNSKWKRLNLDYVYKTDRSIEIKKPKKFSKMIELSEQISKNYPFLRVDFYEVNGKLYFGELTFFPESGFGKFYPDKYDKIFGNILTLPNK